MKLTIRHVQIRSTDGVDSWVEQCIFALQPRLQIDEAHVSLERRRDLSPSFCVQMHLVTPGPDVFAESRDHTLRAAIGKALCEVEAKIDQRWLKQAQRVRMAGEIGQRFMGTRFSASWSSPEIFTPTSARTPATARIGGMHLQNAG